MINFVDTFPQGFTPTDAQTKALNEITEAFNKHKFVICCAPTGSGKSFIAKSIANASKSPDSEYVDLVNSYYAYDMENGEYVYHDEFMDKDKFGGSVLTITKALQDQYERLFADMQILKGKSNYQCQVDTNFTVDVAPCLFVEKMKKDCWGKNTCTYYNARNKSITSRFSVFNYTMFMCLPEHLKQRQYLICDEAAELEDEIVKNYSIDLRTKVINNLLPDYERAVDVDNLSSVKQYINELCPLLYDKIQELEKKISGKKKSPNSNDVARLTNAKTLHGQISTALDHWNQSEYLAERTKTGITVSPLRVDKLSKNLFDCADKVLLMSATIIDPANFAKSLGITDYAYIEMPSTFDATKAPIVVSSKYKMNRSNWEKLMPTFKNIILQICNNHKNDKGIIHTHNMDITNYLRQHLKDTRFLVREQGIANQEILEQHIAAQQNTVLVSPSMTHGVDLKDDLARFQIIVKAPFLPLNSKRIKKLFDMDTQWYANRMLTTVIQAAGRGIRSIDDHCVTYILDGNIVQSILDNADKLPKYFLKRFI